MQSTTNPTSKKRNLIIIRIPAEGTENTRGLLFALNTLASAFKAFIHRFEGGEKIDGNEWQENKKKITELLSIFSEKLFSNTYKELSPEDQKIYRLGYVRLTVRLSYLLSMDIPDLQSANFGEVFKHLESAYSKLDEKETDNLANITKQEMDLFSGIIYHNFARKSDVLTEKMQYLERAEHCLQLLSLDGLMAFRAGLLFEDKNILPYAFYEYLYAFLLNFQPASDKLKQFFTIAKKQNKAFCLPHEVLHCYFPRLKLMVALGEPVNELGVLIKHICQIIGSQLQENSDHRCDQRVINIILKEITNLAKDEIGNIPDSYVVLISNLYHILEIWCGESKKNQFSDDLLLLSQKPSREEMGFICYKLARHLYVEKIEDGELTFECRAIAFHLFKRAVEHQIFIPDYPDNKFLYKELVTHFFKEILTTIKKVETEVEKENASNIILIVLGHALNAFFYGNKKALEVVLKISNNDSKLVSLIEPINFAVKEKNFNKDHFKVIENILTRITELEFFKKNDEENTKASFIQQLQCGMARFLVTQAYRSNLDGKSPDHELLDLAQIKYEEVIRLFNHISENINKQFESIYAETIDLIKKERDKVTLDLAQLNPPFNGKRAFKLGLLFEDKKDFTSAFYTYLHAFLLQNQKSAKKLENFFSIMPKKDKKSIIPQKVKSTYFPRLKLMRVLKITDDSFSFGIKHLYQIIGRAIQESTGHVYDKENEEKILDKMIWGMEPNIGFRELHSELINQLFAILAMWCKQDVKNDFSDDFQILAKGPSAIERGLIFYKLGMHLYKEEIECQHLRAAFNRIAFDFFIKAVQSRALIVDYPSQRFRNEIAAYFFEKAAVQFPVTEKSLKNKKLSKSLIKAKYDEQVIFGLQYAWGTFFYEGKKPEFKTVFRLYQIIIEYYKLSGEDSLIKEMREIKLAIRENKFNESHFKMIENILSRTAEWKLFKEKNAKEPFNQHLLFDIIYFLTKQPHRKNPDCNGLDLKLQALALEKYEEALGILGQVCKNIKNPKLESIYSKKISTFTQERDELSLALHQAKSKENSQGDKKRNRKKRRAPQNNPALTQEKVMPIEKETVLQVSPHLEKISEKREEKKQNPSKEKENKPKSEEERKISNLKKSFKARERKQKNSADAEKQKLLALLEAERAKVNNLNVMLKKEKKKNEESEEHARVAENQLKQLVSANEEKEKKNRELKVRFQALEASLFEQKENLKSTEQMMRLVEDKLKQEIRAAEYQLWQLVKEKEVAESTLSIMAANLNEAKLKTISAEKKVNEAVIRANQIWHDSYCQVKEEQRKAIEAETRANSVEEKVEVLTQHLEELKIKLSEMEMAKQRRTIPKELNQFDDGKTISLEGFHRVNLESWGLPPYRVHPIAVGLMYQFHKAGFPLEGRGGGLGWRYLKFGPDGIYNEKMPDFDFITRCSVKQISEILNRPPDNKFETDYLWSCYEFQVEGCEETRKIDIYSVSDKKSMAEIINPCIATDIVIVVNNFIPNEKEEVFGEVYARGPAMKHLMAGTVHLTGPLICPKVFFKYLFLLRDLTLMKPSYTTSIQWEEYFHLLLPSAISPERIVHILSDELLYGQAGPTLNVLIYAKVLPYLFPTLPCNPETIAWLTEKINQINEERQKNIITYTNCERKILMALMAASLPMSDVLTQRQAIADMNSNNPFFKLLKLSKEDYRHMLKMKNGEPNNTTYCVTNMKMNTWYNHFYFPYPPQNSQPPQDPYPPYQGNEFTGPNNK